MRYICPTCAKPYTATSRNTFPRHGRRWVVGRMGQPSGWQHCPSAGTRITEETEKHEPKPPGRRP